MTAESLKSFISLPSHGSQCRYSTGSKVRVISFAVFILVFCTAILGLEIWNSIRTTQLTQEVEQLRNALSDMKERIGFDDIIGGLNEFETLYDHTDITTEDEEEDFIESEDDEEDDLYDDEEAGSAFLSDEYEAALEHMYQEHPLHRKSRSVASQHGVPIVQESYALRRNRTNPAVDDTISRLLLNTNTDRPTMKLDWNGRDETPSAYNQPSYHRRPFPKKYQQHRAPPVEYVQPPHRRQDSRSLDEHNSQQYANQHINQQDDSSSSAKTNVHVRRNRVMSTHEDKEKAFRQTVNKREYERLLQNGQILDQPHNANTRPTHKIGRVGRSVHNRAKSIAVHYSGDTTKYQHGHHENFDGNARLRHAGGLYTDWEASPWVNILAMDRFFKLDKGVATVQENGLYYVYAQIFYHDDHDTNGFVVQHNSESFLQCTTMTHSAQRVTKSNTCFTGGITYMRNGDTIQLNDLGNHRYTLFEPAKSFFGLIKMGDARPLHETLD